MGLNWSVHVYRSTGVPNLAAAAVATAFCPMQRETFLISCVGCPGCSCAAAWELPCESEMDLLSKRVLSSSCWSSTVMSTLIILSGASVKPSVLASASLLAIAAYSVPCSSTFSSWLPRSTTIRLSEIVVCSLGDKEEEVGISVEAEVADDVLSGGIANTVESVEEYEDESCITVVVALFVVGLMTKVVAGVSVRAAVVAKGSPPETMKGSNRVDGFAGVVMVSDCG